MPQTKTCDMESGPQGGGSPRENLGEMEAVFWWQSEWKGRFMQERRSLGGQACNAEPEGLEYIGNHGQLLNREVTP